MNPLEDEARIVIFERKNALAAQNVRPFFLHQVLNPGKELVGIERLFGVERNRLHLLIVIVLEPATRMRVDVVMVMMMLVIMIMAMLVMMIVIVAAEEVWLQIENAIEVEGIAAQHRFQRHLGALGPV